jgi:hypothetical protein
MQPLACFQIELIDEARHGGRRARAQRFLDRPQSVFAVCCLDQNKARRIETERAQPMSGKPAILMPPVARHDEDKPLRSRHVGENRRYEAESRGGAAFALWHDFMQGSASKPALRQAGIQSGKAERQRFAPICHPWQQPAQFFHHGGAVSRRSKGSGGNKLWHGCAGPPNVRYMFPSGGIRTK